MPERLRISPADEGVSRALRAQGWKEDGDALWVLDDPYAFSPDRKAGRIFTNDRGTLSHYPPGAIYLPLAFDDLAPVPEVSDTWDVCFVGTPFPRRVILLQALQDLLAGMRTVVAGPGWAGKLDPQIRVLEGRQDARALWCASRVVLQVHRDNFFENPRRIPPDSPSGRIFEAAGLGCCQVVDRFRSATFEHYEEGKELVSFESTEELRGLLTDLVKDSVRRKAIGEAARKRTLAEHTYRHRLLSLVSPRL